MTKWGTVAAWLLLAAPSSAMADQAQDCRRFDVLVTSDPTRLFASCRRLAEAGGIVGQYNLGRLYAAGVGVTQDRVQAHLWFSLAAAGGIAPAAADRDFVAKQMTSDEVAEAQRLARTWTPSAAR